MHERLHAITCMAMRLVSRTCPLLHSSTERCLPAQVRSCVCIVPIVSMELPTCVPGVRVPSHLCVHPTSARGRPHVPSSTVQFRRSARAFATPCARTSTCSIAIRPRRVGPSLLHVREETPSALSRPRTNLWRVASLHREETPRLGSTSLVLNSFVNSRGASSTCSCSSCFACCASRARFLHASRAIGGQEAHQGRPGRQQEVRPRRTRKDRRFRKENRRRNHERESGKKDVA